ncbi:MAG TPA: hypothetical protein VLA24_05260, partial [Pseudomonadales bacterium]|nr:hypothetical protein [Pseudomonadales bacterium]
TKTDGPVKVPLILFAELAAGAVVAAAAVVPELFAAESFAAELAFFVAAAVAFALALGAALLLVTAVEDDEAGATSAVPELTPTEVPEMLNASLAPN